MKSASSPLSRPFGAKLLSINFEPLSLKASEHLTGKSRINLKLMKWHLAACIKRVDFFKCLLILVSVKRRPTTGKQLELAHAFKFFGSDLKAVMLLQKALMRGVVPGYDLPEQSKESGAVARSPFDVSRNGVGPPRLSRGSESLPLMTLKSRIGWKKQDSKRPLQPRTCGLLPYSHWCLEPSLWPLRQSDHKSRAESYPARGFKPGTRAHSGPLNHIGAGLPFE